MGKEWNRDIRRMKDSIRLIKEWILSQNRRKERMKFRDEISIEEARSQSSKFQEM